MGGDEMMEARGKTGLVVFAVVIVAPWLSGCGPDDCEKLQDAIVKAYEECGVKVPGGGSGEVTECSEAAARTARCQTVCWNATSCEVIAGTAPADELLRIHECQLYCLEGAMVPMCASDQTPGVDADGKLVCVDASTDMRRVDPRPLDAGAQDDGGCGASCGVSAVATSDSHSCAIVGGTVKCWGSPAHGQLGFSANMLVLQPTAASPPVTGALKLAAGANHVCAVDAQKLICWGDSAQGQVGTGSIKDTPPTEVGLTDITAIAAGADHTCAVSQGKTWCWGSNALGKLGIGGASENPKETPQLLATLSGVTAIAAGVTHTCAIASGAIKCWGDNTYGQFGIDSTTSAPTPTDGPALAGVTAIAAGYNFTCAIASGAVKCWGSNTSGQLGSGTTDDSLVPVDVVGISSGATAISAGTSYACAIVNGGVKCWGDNNHGQLGSSSAGPSSKEPVDVMGLSTGVTAIDTGFEHACAVMSGAVWCWGRDDAGQLGDRTSGAGNDHPLPVEVQL